MKSLCVLALCISFSLTTDRLMGTEPDPIRDKLNASKAAFEAEMEKYDKAVVEYFEKREEAARNDVNKKLVAQIKLERLAYDESGDLPKESSANVRMLGADAQKKLEAEYQSAAKGYFKAKKDKEADGVEKEILLVLLKAKRATYVVEMKPFETTSIKDVGIGRSPKTVKDSEYDQAIIMHPGERKFSEGVYKLNQKYTSFRGKVAVTRPPGENQKGPETAATFEILGNGKSLWKSKPAVVFDEIQEFSISLRAVDNLILRVHCPGSNTGCHAHWLDPLLIR